MMQLCIIIHGILNLQSKFGCNYKSVNYFNGTSLKVWKFYFQSNQKETSFIEPSVTENPSETENRNRVHNRHEHHHRHQHLHHQHQHHHHHHHRKNGEDGQTASPPYSSINWRTLYSPNFVFQRVCKQNNIFSKLPFFTIRIWFCVFYRSTQLTRLDLLLLLNYTKSHQKPKGGRFPSYSLSIKAGSSNRTQHVHFKPTDIGLFLK